MTNLSTLKEGLQYGNPFTRADLRPGQYFYWPGDRRIASTSGTITKINRTTFEYEGKYFEHTLTIRSRLADYNGALIRDGDTVHVLEL